MANVILTKSIGADEKVALMQSDARFDVADAEADRPDLIEGIKRSIRSKTAPPKVPKVFLSNDCLFNCAYCGCRAGNDCKQRYQITPRELADFAVTQAKRSKHGIFISSAIFKTPDYTVELIIRTLEIIRREMNYYGYVHAKIMPGTDPNLIWRAGLLADRLSVNIEVARSEGYQMVAHNKTKNNILAPMGQISQMIQMNKSDTGRYAPRFATSQSTQLMAGASGEDDYTILNLSGALYRKYALKRVYYTAFQLEKPVAGYSIAPTTTPTWRMQRLYQADRLMQLYGFGAEEIAPGDAPFLSRELDPKAAWALRNLHLFPVEVNSADYEALIRVPGIGITYANRILAARKYGALSHETLKTLGVSLKRSGHFITCGGRYQGDGIDRVETLHALLIDPSKRVTNDRYAISGSVCEPSIFS